MKKINRLIIIFIASSCSNERNETNIGSQLVKSSQYSVQKHVPVYLLDAYALVSTVEKTHPAFALNDEVLKLAGANIESHLAEVTIDNNGAAYKKNLSL